MGDWGYKAYENDEAADWFARFWESKNFDLIESTAATLARRMRVRQIF